MKTITNSLTIVFYTLILTACAQWQKSPVDIADSVYYAGRIYTINEKQPWVEAFAIKDGKFIATGTDAEIKPLIGSHTRVVDLAGMFVMPGLQDAHIHTQMAAEFSINLAVDPHQSWALLSKTITDYVAEHPERTWVFGGNLPWLTESIGEFKNIPAHKSVLDRLVPDRPVVLWDIGGHAVLANSKALATAGIDNNTPNPVGGTIERDAKGEATGVLRELAANLVIEVMNPIKIDRFAAGAKRVISQLNALGITSINEAWTYPQFMKALKALDNRNELTMRVTTAIAHPVEFVTPAAKQAAATLITNRDQYHGKHLKPKYVKFVLDGSAGGQTLAMVDPYEGTDFRGDMRNPEDIVMSEVSRLHSMGIGSVLHAVGDRAIRVALNAVEQAIETHGDNGVRHVIAHTVFVNPEDIDRFAKLGVIAEFSPYFWQPSDGLEIVRHDIGEERTNWGFPIKILLDKNVPIAAGSDWPVVFDPNPFPAIEAMVTRELPGGSADSYGKQYAITLKQAVNIFTLGGAYEHYQEDETGSIEVGKYADFIVLDRNLFDIDVREIHKTHVVSTILEGQVVYQM